MFSSRDGHCEREVARLAAIAAIRTFLNYFLERDLGDIRTRQGLAPSDSD